MNETASLLVRNVRPWGGDAVDITVDAGRVRTIYPADPAATGGIDGRSLLALPGLVNSHAHIDKSWWGLPPIPGSLIYTSMPYTSLTFSKAACRSGRALLNSA